MGGPGKSDGRLVHSIDNFLPVKFTVDGVEYPSVENYFQCQKATNNSDFEKVRRGGTGADVWMVGSSINLRPDWEEVKVRVMYTGSKAKHEQHENLKKELLSTRGRITFSNSTNFWNLWNARVSELVREELREKGERDEEKIKELWDHITEYEKHQKK